MNRRLQGFLKPFKRMPSLVRIIIGLLLLVGGFLGILPILGFWMIPLGLLVLSLDFRWARRGYLYVTLRYRQWNEHRKLQKIRNQQSE